MLEHGARSNSQNARRSKQKVGVNVKETARFTVTITDNLKCEMTEVSTNVMCASIKNFNGEGASNCVLVDSNDGDILTTIITAFSAVKSLCEMTDHIANYKGLLLLELKKLKMDSDREKSKQEGLI